MPRKKITTAIPGATTASPVPDPASPVTALLPRSMRRLMKIPDVETKIRERMDDLLQAMLDRALGHYVVVNKFNKDTGEVETRVYLEPPDVKAGMFLIENVIGRVPQRVEMTGEGGGPVKVIPWMTMDDAEKLGLRATLIGASTAASNGDGSEDEDEDDNIIDGEVREVIQPREAPPHILAAFEEEVGHA